MKCLCWTMAACVLVVSQLSAEDVEYSRLELIHTLQGHEATIRALAISSDGRTLASAGQDKTVRLWDVSTGKVRAVLRGHEFSVRTVRFSPDDTMLVSGAYGGDDDVIRLWDVATGKQRAPLTATKTATRFVTFSPDGKTLAWDDRGKAIRLGDVSTGKETAILPNSGVVREIVFSPDGRSLAISFYHNGGLQVWHSDGNEIGAVEGEFASVKFYADGKTLVAGQFRKITKWDISNGKELKKVETVSPTNVNADPFPNALLSPNAKTLATVDKDLAVVNLSGDLGTFGERSCRLILMDSSSGTERTIYETRGRENWFRLVTFSPSGNIVALQNSDYSYSLVDVASGEETARLSAPDLKRGSGYPQIAFAPDDKTVAISRGTAIKLWVIP